MVEEIYQHLARNNPENYTLPQLMKYKRPQLISKGSFNRLLQSIGEAWNRKKFQEAIDLAERACRLDPANVGLFLDLGRFYGLRYDSAAAERCFEKAIRMSPNKIDTLALAGLNCRDFHDFALAESYYLRATQEKKAGPELYVQLAKMYELQRRMDEANAMVKQALHLNPQYPETLLVRARFERQAGQIETAGQTIRALLANPCGDAWILAQGWYELGTILDRQAKYDDAINAFVQAKSLVHPHSGRFLAELKIVRKRIMDMQANLTADSLRRWLATEPSLLPPRRLALLGGHPRSGTTLLEQVLDSHSDIVSLEETAVFHDDAYSLLLNQMPDETPILSFLEPASTQLLQTARSNYFRSAELSLGEPIGKRLLIDKNPSLTFLVPALIRIFPEIKLLIALRDPRDVVLSCFMQPFRPEAGNVGYQRIQSTVEEYTTMMNLWLTIKPMIQGHYLEVRYEDMVADLESVARQSLAFLGMPWDAQVLGFDAHARKKLVRSPTYADVTQPVYQRAKGRWRNYQKYLAPHLAQLEPFVKAFGYE